MVHFVEHLSTVKKVAACYLRMHSSYRARNNNINSPNRLVNYATTVARHIHLPSKAMLTNMNAQPFETGKSAFFVVWLISPQYYIKMSMQCNAMVNMTDCV